LQFKAYPSFDKKALIERQELLGGIGKENMEC
jgi:hypothetical protein